MTVKYCVEYQVFDISKAKKIRTSTVYGIPNKNRQLAHYVSDGIYQEITGIPGIASTKILYVTEDNNFKLLISDADGSNEQVLLESHRTNNFTIMVPDSKKLHMFHLKQELQKSIYKTLRLEKEMLLLRTHHR